GVFAALLVSAAAWILRRVQRRLRSAFARRRRRRHALADLERAANASALAAALRQLGAAEGWRPWLTLQEWAGRWQRRYRTGPAFASSVEHLAAALYGGRAVDVPALRRSLATELRGGWRWRTDG